MNVGESTKRVIVSSDKLYGAAARSSPLASNDFVLLFCQHDLVRDVQIDSYSRKASFKTKLAFLFSAYGTILRRMPCTRWP